MVWWLDVTTNLVLGPVEAELVHDSNDGTRWVLLTYGGRWRMVSEKMVRKFTEPFI